MSSDVDAALAAAFYAAHHVLVKGALFLSVGVIAATGSRRLWPMLLPAASRAFFMMPIVSGGKDAFEKSFIAFRQSPSRLRRRVRGRFEQRWDPGWS